MKIKKVRGEAGKMIRVSESWLETKYYEIFHQKSLFNIGINDYID